MRSQEHAVLNIAIVIFVKEVGEIHYTKITSPNEIDMYEYKKLFLKKARLTSLESQ